MKSSRTNSFRLHQISRASSAKKQSQTFYLPDETFKLSAINSVSRGIKHNQLSFLVGDDLNKLRNQPTVATDQFYQTAHLCLTDTRKKYDEAKKQRVKADQNIIKLKQQIKKYKTIQDQYLDKMQVGKKQVQNMQKSLEAKRMLLEETQMQKKVLFAMRMRLKSDKVVYDQRKFDLGKQFSFQSKQINILRKDGFFVGEENERAERVYQKFMNQLALQSKQRQQHLRNIQSMIEEKQRYNQNNIAREHQINQIAERAMQDKQPIQEEWYRIYLTHVFVSKMLRNKIDREMQKFSIVQFAFKTIKTATGVNDSKTFVRKFLNKQAQYGEMLGRITANEKKINELKQLRDFLLEQQKQLQMDKQTYEMLKLKNIDISHQIKQYQMVSDNEKKIETYISKISSWLNKQAKKFSSIEKPPHISFDQSRNKQALKQNFNKFCKILLQTLMKCQKQDFSEQQTSAGDLSARDSARVARIMPKKSLKNSEGEQVYEIQEQQLPHTAQVQQKQVIDAQREDLIKSNERFMKQARKRLEQRKKINLQKQGEKKKPLQVKKEQV